MKSKAVFFTGNKSAQIMEIDVLEPQHDEIQAKTIINGICMFEVWQYNTQTFEKPELVGHEGVGIVTKIGKDITEVKIGDYVATSAWSEYTNIHKSNIIKLSCSESQLENYLVEPVACAVNAVSYMNIFPGDRAIVFGAGYMGLLLIQLLKYTPLSELVVVDIKQENLDLALEFGANRVINLSQNGAEELEKLQENRFEICYEASSSKDALDWCTKLARAGGKIGIYSWHHQPRLVDTSVWHERGLQVLNVAPGIASSLKKYTSFFAADRLMGIGKIDQSKLITHRYKLEDIDKAMKESSLREGKFIKSMIYFG